MGTDTKPRTPGTKPQAQPKSAQPKPAQPQRPQPRTLDQRRAQAERRAQEEQRAQRSKPEQRPKPEQRSKAEQRSKPDKPRSRPETTARGIPVKEVPAKARPRPAAARAAAARAGAVRTAAARAVSSPRHTRPTVAKPGVLKPDAVKPTALRPDAAKPGAAKPGTARTSTAPQAQPHIQGPSRGSQYRQQRMPFILLLVGLLGGALVSLLVISTTLDQGSYDINNLTTQNTMLHKDEQALENSVADLQNPAVIASEAAALGLRKQPDERFINPGTGTILVAPAVTPEP